jgi:hypothetical protein
LRFQVGLKVTLIPKANICLYKASPVVIIVAVSHLLS